MYSYVCFSYVGHPPFIIISSLTDFLSCFMVDFFALFHKIVFSATYRFSFLKKSKILSQNSSSSALYIFFCSFLNCFPLHLLSPFLPSLKLILPNQLYLSHSFELLYKSYPLHIPLNFDFILHSESDTINLRVG